MFRNVGKWKQSWTKYVYPVSYILYPVSYILYPISCTIPYTVSSMLYSVSSVLHITPCAVMAEIQIKWTIWFILLATLCRLYSMNTQHTLDYLWILGNKLFAGAPLANKNFICQTLKKLLYAQNWKTNIGSGHVSGQRIYFRSKKY